MTDIYIVIFWLFIILVLPTLTFYCGILIGRMDIKIENKEKEIIKEEKLDLTCLEECANELSCTIAEFDIFEMKRDFINRLYKLIDKWREEAKRWK